MPFAYRLIAKENWQSLKFFVSFKLKRQNSSGGRPRTILGRAWKYGCNLGHSLSRRTRYVIYRGERVIAHLHCYLCNLQCNSASFGFKFLFIQKDRFGFRLVSLTSLQADTVDQAFSFLTFTVFISLKFVNLLAEHHVCGKVLNFF